MTTKTEFLPMDYKTHLFDEIKDKTGYTNLKTHAIGHDNVNEILESAKNNEKENRIAALGVSVQVDQKDIGICGWIEGIVFANQPFMFVEIRNPESTQGTLVI